MTGLDRMFYSLYGVAVELPGGKLTHYALDQLGKWRPRKLRGHGWVTLPTPLCT